MGDIRISDRKRDAATTGGFGNVLFWSTPLQLSYFFGKLNETMLLVMNSSIIQSEKLQSRSQPKLSLLGFKLISFMQSVSSGIIVSVRPINRINCHLSLVCLRFLKMISIQRSLAPRKGRLFRCPGLRLRRVTTEIPTTNAWWMMKA